MDNENNNQFQPQKNTERQQNFNQKSNKENKAGVLKIVVRREE